VALWTGKQASPYVPFVNIAPVVAGTNGISPIFLTTVGVTGGIGVDLKNCLVCALTNCPAAELSASGADCVVTIL